MKEKTGTIIGMLIAIVVIITLAAWIINTPIFGYVELGSFFILIILIASASYILWDRAKNIRKGLPAKDERLKSINYKAGYYGFIAAIWGAVFGPTLIDIVYGYELEGHLVTALVVIVAGFTFIVSYLFLAWKGN